MNLDQVLPQAFVGSCPECTEDIDCLQREFSISAVLNLQTDEDFQYLNLDWDTLEEHYHESAIRLRRVPVRDFDPVDLRRNLPQCVRTLNELLENDGIVYVHCNMGLGRSPSVVITYLHWVHQWDLERAAEHVTRCRPCSPNLDAIRLASEDLARDRAADRQ